MKTFEEMGVCVPKILLPKIVDTKTWATIACDQYTQDENYWKNVEKTVGNEPSTLNITLPEIYLNNDKTRRIEKIKKTMKNYVENGIFDEAKNAFVYVERKTAFNRTRKGLVVAIDLEKYEWKPFSTSLIRATEATIKERIPPRMEIRQGAMLEVPHIMLLINDKDNSFIEKIGEKAKTKKPLYSGDLMMNSGSISGWAVESADELETVRKGLETLYNENTLSDKSTFLFAVGDGNHSLATAKSVWDEAKTDVTGDCHCECDTSQATKAISNNSSPLRYALVEIVNIYDPSLVFEPIHRVVFNMPSNDLISSLEKKLSGKTKNVKNFDELKHYVSNSKNSFGFVWTEKNANCTSKTHFVLMETSIKELAVSRMQVALDGALKESNDSLAKIDYIHGEAEVLRLGSEAEKCVTGILLPPIAKDNFFQTIATTGPLPRKSFSMGEASEKRFYMECRSLFS